MLRESLTETCSLVTAKMARHVLVRCHQTPNQLLNGEM